MRRTIIIVVSIFILAFTFYLLIVPINQNPIYNFVKPTVDNKYYILIEKSTEQITIEDMYHFDCTVLTVQPLNTGLNKVGGEENLYIPDSNLILNEIKKGDIIVVAWLRRIDGKSRILSVVTYESFVKLNDNKLFIK